MQTAAAVASGRGDCWHSQATKERCAQLPVCPPPHKGPLNRATSPSLFFVVPRHDLICAAHPASRPAPLFHAPHPSPKHESLLASPLAHTCLHKHHRSYTAALTSITRRYAVPQTDKLIYHTRPKHHPSPHNTPTPSVAPERKSLHFCGLISLCVFQVHPPLPYIFLVACAMHAYAGTRSLQLKRCGIPFSLAPTWVCTPLAPPAGNPCTQPLGPQKCGPAYGPLPFLSSPGLASLPERAGTHYSFSPLQSCLVTGAPLWSPLSALQLM